MTRLIPAKNTAAMLLLFSFCFLCSCQLLLKSSPKKPSDGQIDTVEEEFDMDMNIDAPDTAELDQPADDQPDPDDISADEDLMDETDIADIPEEEIDEHLLNGVIQISAGSEHTCALLESGSLKCWGQNTSGQLGDGSTDISSIPVDVYGLTDVIQVSAGCYHTCALLDGGSLRCWGYNEYGQLGDETTDDSLTPVAVSRISSADAIGAGGCLWGSHTCALLPTGSLKCWGQNTYGQLGNGSTVDSSQPVDVLDLSIVVSLSPGCVHTCAVQHNAAWCWGDNNAGQLGDDTTVQRNEPVSVSGTSFEAFSIDTGQFHTCAVTTTGQVKCWGNNDAGQLGDGTIQERHTPVDTVMISAEVTAVSAGNFHTCTLTNAGAVLCWGNNYYGQLGNETNDNSSIPVNVVELPSNVTAISAGGNHTCALLPWGTVKCWGSNSSGQLGDGTMTDHNTPVSVVSG